MYGILWSALPGPTWLRAVIAIVAVVAVVVFLLEVVFPWIGPMMPGADPEVQTVGLGAG